MAGRAVKAILGIALVVFLSKVLGLSREMVIADRFGTTSEYDLYLIAVMLPALAYGIINFAIFYLLVPHLTRLFESNPSEDAEHWRQAWALFNKLMLTAIGITLAIVVLAPVVMPIWATGQLGDDLPRIVFYARCTAVMAILGTCEAFLRAMLNVKHIFTFPAAGYIVDNLIEITIVVVLAPFLSIGAVVMGLIAGLLAQNLFLSYRVFRLGGFKHYSLSLKEKSLALLLPTAGVLLLIELLNRSYFLIDRYVASNFGEGVISALNYGQVLVQLPDAIVGFAIASVVFPMFSSIEHENDPERFGQLYRQAVTGGFLVALPIALFFYTNAEDIVHVILLRGVFDARSLELTTNILQPYAPTIAALFIISTSVRACHGRGWGKAVLLLTAAAFVVKLAGTMLFPKIFDYAGISLATTTSMLVLAAGLLVLVLRRSRSERNIEFRHTVLKLVAMGALLAIALLYLSDFVQSLQSDFSWLAAAERLTVLGVALIGMYSLLIYLFGFSPYLKKLRGVPAHAR